MNDPIIIPGIPTRVLERQIFDLQKQIWEQQIYNNWLLWLLDGDEREWPIEPIEETPKEKSLEEILSEPVEEPEQEISFDDVVNQPIIKTPEFDPFETIANLQDILDEFVQENNLLSLIISQRPRPKYFVTFKEYRSK
jgi:hypothetical protein